MSGSHDVEVVAEAGEVHQHATHARLQVDHRSQPWLSHCLRNATRVLMPAESQNVTWPKSRVSSAPRSPVRKGTIRSSVAGEVAMSSSPLTVGPANRNCS